MQNLLDQKLRFSLTYLLRVLMTAHITKTTRRQTTWNSPFRLEFAVWVGIRDFRLMAGGNRGKQLEITKQRGIHGKAVEFSQQAWNSACILEFGVSFKKRRSGAHGGSLHDTARVRVVWLLAVRRPLRRHVKEGGRTRAERGETDDTPNADRGPPKSARSPRAVRSPDAPRASHCLARVGRLLRVSPQTRHRRAAEEGARFTAQSARKDERPTRTEQFAHQAARRACSVAAARAARPYDSKRDRARGSERALDRQ